MNVDLNDATLAPVIAIALTTLIGALVYSFQKQVDRRNALIELRRGVYQEFLNAIIDVIDGGPEALARYNKCAARLVVVASDDVAKKVGEWRNYMAQTSADLSTRDMRISKQLMAEFVAAMRKDCFERTRLARQRIYDMLPIQD